MKTFFFFQLSAGQFALILLISCLVALIAVVHFFAKSNRKVKYEVDYSENETVLYPDTNSSDHLFSVRKIDEESNKSYLSTGGEYGFTICKDKKTGNEFIFFFVDNKGGATKPILKVIDKTNGEEYRLKINQETSMFSFGNIRFYKIDNECISAMKNEHFELYSGDKRLVVNDNDFRRIVEASNSLCS